MYHHCKHGTTGATGLRLEFTVDVQTQKEPANSEPVSTAQRAIAQGPKLYSNRYRTNFQFFTFHLFILFCEAVKKWRRLGN